MPLIGVCGVRPLGQPEPREPQKIARKKFWAAIFVSFACGYSTLPNLTGFSSQPSKLCSDIIVNYYFNRDFVFKDKTNAYESCWSTPARLRDTERLALTLAPAHEARPLSPTRSPRPPPTPTPTPPHPHPRPHAPYSAPCSRCPQRHRACRRASRRSPSAPAVRGPCR